MGFAGSSLLFIGEGVCRLVVVLCCRASCVFFVACRGCYFALLGFGMPIFLVLVWVICCSMLILQVCGVVGFVLGTCFGYAVSGLLALNGYLWSFCVLVAGSTCVVVLVGTLMVNLG